MLGHIICIIAYVEAEPQEIHWTKVSIKSKSCKGFQKMNILKSFENIPKSCQQNISFLIPTVDTYKKQFKIFLISKTPH